MSLRFILHDIKEENHVLKGKWKKVLIIYIEKEYVGKRLQKKDLEVFFLNAGPTLKFFYRNTWNPFRNPLKYRGSVHTML